jgi:hypothetical protein
LIRVTPSARHREDRAGDPLDGLVNLFDLGIVLSVAFLLAALASLNLTGTLKHGLKPVAPNDITVSPGQTIHTLPSPGPSVVGPGTQVGTVYQLPSGQLVYVTGTQAPTTITTPNAVTTPTTGTVPTLTPPPNPVTTGSP